MIFKRNKLCVQRNDLVLCGVFSELHSKLSFAENILSFTPSVGISGSSLRHCFVCFLVCHLLVSA